MYDDEKVVLVNLLQRFRGARMINASEPVCMLTPNEIVAVESCIEEARARDLEEDLKARERERQDALAAAYAEQQAKEKEERLRLRPARTRTRKAAKKGTRKGTRKRTRK